MNWNFSEKSLDEFSQMLFSKTPAPGGGAACAYVAAMGASLVGMMGNFTVGKKKYADSEEEVFYILEKVGNARARLLHLASLDSAAFDTVSKAYEMPKDTLERSLAISEGLRETALVPVEVMKICAENMEYALRLLSIGNLNLASDAGSAAEFFLAAAKGSMFNVVENTSRMDDLEMSERFFEEAKALLAQCHELESEIYGFLLDMKNIK